MYQASNVVTLQPGSVYHAAPQKDYLVWTVVNLLCCCLPLSLAALYFSIKTRDANHKNNMSQAERYSHKAQALNISATVIGVVFNIIFIIFYFIFLFYYKDKIKH